MESKGIKPTSSSPTLLLPWSVQLLSLFLRRLDSKFLSLVMPYTQESYFVALGQSPTFCFVETIGDKSIFEIPRAMCIRICAYPLDLLGCQVCPYSLFKTRKPLKFIYFFFIFFFYIFLYFVVILC